MNTNFFKDLKFEVKEFMRRRKVKKNRKSYEEINGQRGKKTESDIDRESMQWLNNRKYKG